MIAIPLQAKVAAWFARNGLKLIAYAFLGLVITLGTLVFYGYQRRQVLKNDIASLSASVAVLADANKTNQETIKTMQSDAKLDDAVITGLFEKLRQIDADDQVTARRIRTLESNNAEVRAWLRTRTPAGVGCVLDDSCGDQNANRAAPAKQKPANGVR